MQVLQSTGWLLLGTYPSCGWVVLSQLSIKGQQVRTSKKFMISWRPEPEAAAAIACKITFDKVFSTKPKANTVSSVTDAIGRRSKTSAWWGHYETNVPGLLHKLKENYWHNPSALKKWLSYRHWWIDVMLIIGNLGRANRIRLGGWLLDCICQSSNWFMTDMRREEKRRLYATDLPEFMHQRPGHGNGWLFSPIAWPMLLNQTIGPMRLKVDTSWTRSWRAMTWCQRNPSCIQGETPISFLNKIQKVATP